MKSFHFSRITNNLVFGNFFIACCAIGMIFTTFLLNDLPVRFTPFTIFLTASTYLLYNFHPHSFNFDYSGKEELINSVKVIAIDPLKKFFYLIVLFVMISSVFFIQARTLVFMIPLAAMAISYSLPLIGIPGKKMKLRELFFFKTPAVALVWAFSTTLIPLVEQNIALDSSFIWWQVTSRSLFIFALCIPFEMRDMEEDKKNDVRTLPVVLGINKTKVIGFFVILLEVITHHRMTQLPGSSILSLDISSLVAFFLILFQDQKRGSYYYKLVVDGTMLVRFILLFIAIRFL